MTIYLRNKKTVALMIYLAQKKVKNKMESPVAMKINKISYNKNKHKKILDNSKRKVKTIKRTRRKKRKIKLIR